MNKPIIAIIMTRSLVGNERKKKIQHVNQDYIDAILMAGGNPIVLPVEYEIDKEVLDAIAGLLLVGGEDVDEKCYVEKIRSSNPRDNIEIDVYKYFKDNNKPILGICRGLQLINVAEGGTLKNIENGMRHFIEEDGWINFHEILIEPGTKVHSMLQNEVYSVSSLHHQRIDIPGEDVVISAYSREGVPEAIEIKGSRFIVGFQGHIEKCVVNYDKYQDVFKRFVEEAHNGQK